MILLTGATGLIGSALLPELLANNHEVRCLVRDPRRLGAERVRVQLSMADLADPRGLRHAVRGASTVIHLAAAIRDQPPKRLEEVTGLGTYRLLKAAEAAGVERFIFFSAIGASTHQRTRYFRAKALAEEAVERSPMKTTIISPSIVYGPDDAWVRLMRRLALLPAMPISGDGTATFAPIWVADVAGAIVGALDAGPGRYELAGPERLTYAQIAELIAAAGGHQRPLVRVPLPFVRWGLRGLRRIVGDAVFATWEEAELMEVPMVAEGGTRDAVRLGVEPSPMRTVLQAG